MKHEYIQNSKTYRPLPATPKSSGRKQKSAWHDEHRAYVLVKGRDFPYSCCEEFPSPTSSCLVIPSALDGVVATEKGCWRMEYRRFIWIGKSHVNENERCTSPSIAATTKRTKEDDLCKINIIYAGLLVNCSIIWNLWGSCSFIRVWRTIQFIGRVIRYKQLANSRNRKSRRSSSNGQLLIIKLLELARQHVAVNNDEENQKKKTETRKQILTYCTMSTCDMIVSEHKSWTRNER